jgi:hypothetical protein
MHRTLCRCLLFLVFPTLSISGQGRPPSPSPLPPALKQVARRAGTIFAGTVTSVTPLRLANSGQVESVQITFQIEQAIRGVGSGQQKLTIREWAGLWLSGERYRVGERLMLFLYAPSKIGLTSSVGGPPGVSRSIEKDGFSSTHCNRRPW